MMVNTSIEYNWNLELLLEGSTLSEWIERYFNSQDLMVRMLKDNLFDNQYKLREFHELEEKSSNIKNRIQIYVQNKKNTEQSNQKWFEIEQEFISRSIPFSQSLGTFLEQAIKNQSKIHSYLNSEDFREFQRYYEILFRYKYHRLSSRLYKFKLTFSPLDSSYYEIFNILIDREFFLSNISDSEGKIISVHSYPEYLKIMKSEDRILRKNLYLKYNDFVYFKRESLSRLIYYNFLSLNIESRNLKFRKGYLERSLYSDEVDKRFLFLFYKNMKKVRSSIVRFRSTREKVIKKMYNLEDFHEWDSHLELKFSEQSKLYSIDEAKEIVYDSLSILGEEYVDCISKIFNSQWIDWAPKKDKISGAYYSGGAAHLPCKFILLNYNGYFEDVLTLAHELGHAVHEMQIEKKQKFYTTPTIFISEVASIFNENLVSYYMIGLFKKMGNKERLIYIYDHLIRTFIGTSVVQLIYSEWEYEMNNLILQNKIIDVEQGISQYSRLLNLYLGKIVSWKDNLEDLKSLCRIFTIPHFYSGDFYVYKYSVGQVVSLLLSELTIDSSTRKCSVDHFFNFLKSGDSRSNLETINLLPFSVLEKESWDKISQIFKSWVNEFCILSKEVYGV